ncbi:Spectrin beta chain, non-erythrocytic 1 [Ilyodon furcidens]|uniref:Spectrin beta chain, non-erythrocytic 1 n=1 Tax=Ilyodon furcidens TaxID=33524 RepID=A0ABV0U9V2_9TELE
MEPDPAQQVSYNLLEGRFKQLQDEREAVQKKTFTKWVNSHLSRVSCRITDLYMDLRDGRMLIKLLEVLSGEKLPKPTKGRMRIHCLENVDKALQFLKEQRVHLENMGSHDIVDGNHRLTLGLIWTIILRFQTQSALNYISHPPIHTLTEVRLPYTGASEPSDHHQQASQVKCLAQGHD